MSAVPAGLAGVASRDADGRPLTMTIAPQRGGKITAITSATREWLSRAGRLLTSPSGVGFTDAEMAGWDECAPTISGPDLPDGTTLSDHGDLWDRSWRVSEDDGGVATTVAGTDWPYSFTRTVRPAPGGFEFDYRVESRAAVARPFLWAAHPQFLADPGSWVEIPEADLVIDIADPERRLGNAADLQRVPEGRSRKLWTLADDEVRQATLHHPDGSWLRLSWAGPAVRWCGIWIDAAEYAERRVIAVEPSTGWYDSAAHAAAAGRVLVLEPGQQEAWTLRIELGEPGTAGVADRG